MLTFPIINVTEISKNVQNNEKHWENGKTQKQMKKYFTSAVTWVGGIASPQNK